ncbi:MAG: methyl-accepting chemotaxis protein [Methylococcaceae bacterium]|nr:methyl-accepting chemotaxis protein [Methylococcaceae bacterium]
MNWFLNLSTRGKLFVGYGAKLVFMTAIMITAYLGISAIQESQQNLYRREFADALDLMKLRVHDNGTRTAVLAMIVTTKRAEQETWHQDIQQRGKEIGEIMRRLLERNHGNQHLAGRLEELSAIRDTFSQTRDNQVIPLIYAGKLEQAKSLVMGTQYERYKQVRAIARELGDEVEEQARLSVADSERKSLQVVYAIAIVGLVFTLFGLAMVVFLSRVIATPLRALSNTTERLALGDLTVNIPPDNRTDEVGSLIRTFRTMIEKLRKTTLEINEGAGVLASASAEILATTTQVASGAAETSSAVSQTTVTVEEVKQTAQLASQKIKSVADSAQKVAQVSKAGCKSVEEAIEGMQRIQDQMETIAESIMRLSEQGQAISEIFATVNDLAEQSNLLAVNAAIEATKAGEQGKGFSVVAHEIKSLAEQSKQATAQVRAILGDIQKATSAAMMATEQGTKAVEAGVKQSDQAGDSIRLLADSVNEAAQAATQIAVSSHQQMVGMDQVALAMQNIKQASLQNVAGTQQAESAAQNLHELGKKLKQLASQYKV